MIRALTVVAALGLASCRPAPAGSEPKPRLLFISSLPILFGERFALESPPSPLRDALETHFDLHPIDLADASSLRGGKLMLMAQPRAQTAEALVDLDAWVRGGGRLLLLADPRLRWPTATQLGDRTGPIMAFADTGLLKHWGLTLFQPAGTGSAGIFEADRDGDCAIDASGTVARCAIGSGQATIIGDADFVRDEIGAARVVEELTKLSPK